MPDLLLELFSEEIPARMQRQAAEDLKRLVTDALVERGLLYEGAQSFATPRRLALHVVGLPAAQPDLREERKGPRVGAPDAAIQGFLKSAGLDAHRGRAKIETDAKKGEFYVAVIEKPGRATHDVIAEIAAGDHPRVSLAEIDALGRGLRDARRAALGAAAACDRLHASAARTRRRRSSHSRSTGSRPAMSPSAIASWRPRPIKVRRFDDYVAALRKAKVVLDARAAQDDHPRRRAQTSRFAQGLELVEDEGLLEEVAGLVEWPVVLMGEFERGVPRSCRPK